MEVMTVGMDPFEYFAKLLKLNCYSLGGGGGVCVYYAQLICIRGKLAKRFPI